MNNLKVISIILIVIGAILNYIVPIFLKKKATTDDDNMKKIYITKSFGLILVIIGCVMIFWLGGKFGV